MVDLRHSIHALGCSGKFLYVQTEWSYANLDELGHMRVLHKHEYTEQSTMPLLTILVKIVHGPYRAMYIMYILYNTNVCIYIYIWMYI